MDIHPVQQSRIHAKRQAQTTKGPVAYWMSRDQRLHENWCLLHAQNIAHTYRQPLYILFCLSPQFLEASSRQYQFMLAGLKEVAAECVEYAITFHLLTGEPRQTLPAYLKEKHISHLVCDFDPLQIKQDWQRHVFNESSCGWDVVDGHNIVPAREVSPKQEYAAYTFRPKIQKLLPHYLDDFPKLLEHSVPPKDVPSKMSSVQDFSHTIDVPPIEWLRPGTRSGKGATRAFIEKRLSSYAQEQNDPNSDVQSHLSPFIHFGQISAQWVARQIQKAKAISHDNKENFLEQLIIRRELSENFCLYCSSYDSLECLPQWAQDTLDKHWKDSRNYVYSIKELEQAQTHDDLWNAAQQEMVVFGKMHGFLRMYWAKKILEWTENPRIAMQYAVELNDRYELDGRDPNGYVGILWSIGGLHDRAWKERPVFGKIRYMNYEGCKRKFNVQAYIEKVSNLVHSS